MPEDARNSVSSVTCVTVRLAGAAAEARRPDAGATEDAAISSVFQAWQAGHCPCHWGVRAPQEPHT
jgi:hypothetical protein